MSAPFILQKSPSKSINILTLLNPYLSLVIRLVKTKTFFPNKQK